MAIKKPTEMNFSDKDIIAIISGLPGVGKTTLALSAPDVLLIDADEGLSRIKPEHRRDSSICKTYEEVLNDIHETEGTYKTIVIDTCGALIDMMKDWAIRTDPKASKASGGISLQGFGTVKAEFIRFSAELRKKFNVIFLFHESKERNGDDIFYDIVCEGSARTLVWQPADLGAHLHIMNGKRYLGFTPTANYNAKAAYGIKGLIEVPELEDGQPNDFLTKLFSKVRANLNAESESLGVDMEKYHKAMSNGLELIETITDPDQVNSIVEQIKALDHGLTSEKELLATLKKHLGEVGIKWDKATKSYVRS